MQRVKRTTSSRQNKLPGKRYLGRTILTSPQRNGLTEKLKDWKCKDRVDKFCKSSVVRQTVKAPKTERLGVISIFELQIQINRFSQLRTALEFVSK